MRKQLKTKLRAAVAIVVFLVATLVLKKPLSPLSTREQLELWHQFQTDTTRLDIIDEIAKTAISGPRFERNYAIRILGAAGSVTAPRQRHLDIIFDGLYSDDLFTIEASADALIELQLSVLPLHVLEQIEKILTSTPATSAACQLLIALQHSSGQVRGESSLIDSIREVAASNNHVSSEQASRLLQIVVDGGEAGDRDGK